MPTEKLADLIMMLPPPLGLKGAPRRRAVRLGLHLLINDGLAAEGELISFASGASLRVLREWYIVRSSSE